MSYERRDGGERMHSGVALRPPRGGCTPSIGRPRHVSGMTPLTWYALAAAVRATATRAGRERPPGADECICFLFSIFRRRLSVSSVAPPSLPGAAPQVGGVGSWEVPASASGVQGGGVAFVASPDLGGGAAQPGVARVGSCGRARARAEKKKRKKTARAARPTSATNSRPAPPLAPAASVPPPPWAARNRMIRS